MKEKLKTGLYGFILITLVLAIIIPSYAAITGESLMNVQDATVTTYLKPNRLFDGGTIGDDQEDGILAVSILGYDGTAFDRIRGDDTNGLAVDVTRISGSSTSVGDNTPADAYANPTDALDNNSLTSEFNGTTWDRARHSFTQSTTGITANGAGTTVDMTTTPMSKFSMVIDLTAGATTVIDVDLECSINNTAFVPFITVTDLTAEPTLDTLGDTPCSYMRYNVIDVGSGNTLAIDILATR